LFDFLVDIQFWFKFCLPLRAKFFKSPHVCTSVHYFGVRGEFLDVSHRACVYGESVLNFWRAVCRRLPRR